MSEVKTRYRNRPRSADGTRLPENVPEPCPGHQRTHSARTAKRLSLPPIVLRNPAGLPIDTNTSYQRAIEESRQILAEAQATGNMTVRLGPSEWRLPHAPVPSRPDYSRALGTGSVLTNRQRKAALKRTFGQFTEQPKELMAEQSLADHMSAIHTDLTLTRGNTSLDTAAFVENRRQWLLLCRLADAVIGPTATAPLMSSDIPTKAARHSFLPFTGASQLSEFDINNRMIQHRIKCMESGTRRQLYVPHNCVDGLCGGCRKQRFGLTFCYGCERDSYPHYHQDKTARTGGGFTYVKRDRPLHEIKRNNPLNWRVVLDNGCVVYFDGDFEVSELERYATTLGSEQLIGDLQPVESLQPQLVGTDSHVHLKTTTPTSIYGREEEEEELEEESEQEDDEVGDDSEELDGDGQHERDEELSSDSGREKTRTDLLESTEPVEIGDDDLTTTDENVAERQRKKLYNTPKAFELKRRQKKSVEGSTPFTTDRDLNIPQYGNIDIRKSDKKLTEFVTVQRGDDTWQAPDAFMPQEREENPDDWSLRKLPPSDKPTRTVQTYSPDEREPTAGVAASVTTESHEPHKVKKKKTQSSKTSPERKPKSKKERDQKIRFVNDEKPSATPDSGVGSISRHPLPPIPGSPLPEHTETVVGPRPAPKTQTKTDESQHHRPRTKGTPKKDRKAEAGKRVKSKNDDERTEPKADTAVEQPSDEVRLTPEPPFEPMVFKEHILPIIIPTKHVEHPPLPTSSPPSLPRMMDFIEPVKPVREISVTQLEVPPPMMEPPRQRRPPPALKPKAKPRRLIRPPAMRSGGAPVQVSDVKNIGDPLDFLAKFCIIHPDRLPHYVRVFSKVVGEQMYRYSDVPHPDGQFHYEYDPDDQPPEAATADLLNDLLNENQENLKTVLTDAEAKRIRHFTVVNTSLKPEYAMMGFNEGDQTITKINYTLDTLMDKYEALQIKLENVAVNQVSVLATLARKQFPQLADPLYKPPKPKKSKKKKKGKKKENETKVDDVNAEETEVTDKAAETVAETPRTFQRPSDIDIINRLDEKQLKALNVDAELSRLNLELERLREKLREVDDRIEELEDEKKLVQLYARDEFQRLETDGSKPEQFIRQQSALYQRMHPMCNVEMNVTDIEEALQEINGHLITKKEIQYIYHILNIPGKKRVDIQLFSVIAALSEKVAQVDPFIRKLINKFDYEALNTKMDRSKELFYLLGENETDVPLGKIAARMLAVELAAGGVTPEHTQYVLSKFNRENNGVVDFLDFLTYVPLFIEIHDRILNAPLQLDREW